MSHLSSCPEQIRNLLLSRFLGNQLERFSLSVTGGTKSREAAEESFDPFDITLADGMSKVVQLNPEESTHFSQIFDRPARRSRAEFTVGGVDVGAVAD